ncbi:hypothetical protein D5F01_LYC05663 [Larimichthys crocea]|uniref:Uncharacterized protein n=1 Tax=Larimichthys crocea TaxID=215358 RepID=A0A6G0IZE0_LARCR|nr:hypothetical protein D5F01_LYC05663 [Larimichthys crocea]
MEKDKGKDEQKERGDPSSGQRDPIFTGRNGGVRRRDPLLCKCLVAMGIYSFVDHFDNFNQFIRMPPDQCRLYEFVVRYVKLHTKLHAGIEAQCASALSALDNSGPCEVVDREPDEEEEKGEEGDRGDRVQPRSALRRGGSLIPCTEEFCWDDGFTDAQMIRVC